MGKCNCYEEREECIYNLPPKFRTYGICLGTKEQDRCNCGGDESKCNFYPEKRKKAEKMLNTAEMYIKANEDGKIYYSKTAEAFYSKELGLVEEEDMNQKVEIGDFPTFEHLMRSEWEEIKTMTREEAEKQLGVKIMD